MAEQNASQKQEWRGRIFVEGVDPVEDSERDTAQEQAGMGHEAFKAQNH